MTDHKKIIQTSSIFSYISARVYNGRSFFMQHKFQKSISAFLNMMGDLSLSKLCLGKKIGFCSFSEAEHTIHHPSLDTWVTIGSYECKNMGLTRKKHIFYIYKLPIIGIFRLGKQSCSMQFMHKGNVGANMFFKLLIHV